MSATENQRGKNEPKVSPHFLKRLRTQIEKRNRETSEIDKKIAEKESTKTLVLCVLYIGVFAAIGVEDLISSPTIVFLSMVFAWLSMLTVELVDNW